MYFSMDMVGVVGKLPPNATFSVRAFKDIILPEPVKNDFYITRNGKILQDADIVPDGTVSLVPRLVGGKGGFGSMLRAIGAQIEKTTNREACRDLSGRRLRDINEEKRLKNWIAQQAEREREAAERRKKKLERLCYQPKYDFSDQDYEKARSELTEKVHDAVEEGFRKASSSTSGPSGSKRKSTEQGPSPTKKKKAACLWVDADADELSSSLDTSDSESEGTSTCKMNSVNCKTDSDGDTQEDQQQSTGDGGRTPEDKCTDEQLPAELECNEKVNGDLTDAASESQGPQPNSSDSASADDSNEKEIIDVASKNNT